MYSFVLTLHSWIRWLVLLAGIFTAVRALMGWMNKVEWTSRDNQAGLLFMIGVDVQLLLGFILYVALSPITAEALNDFGAAMADASLRYFAVEHVLLMFIAFALTHVGRAFSKRAADAVQKHKMAAIFFGIATLAILFAIPWFRPLFRFG